MNKNKNQESRFCPYCGVELQHPYWQHIQKKHPEKYTQKETWIKLYQDYTGLGMDEATSLMVISELFNATQEEIKSFLKNAKVL
ncbi:MAG: hypothetical protein KAW51_07975 [Candidatus Lokiarchaeota archaeon]|nr:hypothetical protein [Candidatus Lokiarchaeota archaeon]